MRLDAGDGVTLAGVKDQNPANQVLEACWEARREPIVKFNNFLKREILVGRLEWRHASNELVKNAAKSPHITLFTLDLVREKFRRDIFSGANK